MNEPKHLVRGKKKVSCEFMYLIFFYNPSKPEHSKLKTSNKQEDLVCFLKNVSPCSAKNEPRAFDFKKTHNYATSYTVPSMKNE